MFGDELLLSLHHQQKRHAVFSRRCDERVKSRQVAVSKLVIDDVNGQIVRLWQVLHGSMDEAQKIHRYQRAVDVLILWRRDDIDDGLLLAQRSQVKV